PRSFFVAVWIMPVRLSMRRPSTAAAASLPSSASLPISGEDVSDCAPRRTRPPPRLVAAIAAAISNQRPLRNRPSRYPPARPSATVAPRFMPHPVRRFDLRLTPLATNRSYYIYHADQKRS